MKQLIAIIVFTVSMLGSASAQSDTDSLFKNLSFDTISQAEFEKNLVTNIQNSQNKPSHLAGFQKLRLEEITKCDQICETYLLDTLTGKTMWLPTNYDQGILGIEFSPSGKQFVVFSSYDGLDFENYYDYRAEFFVFNIVEGTGLDAIQISFNYVTTDWSIDDVTWVGGNKLAIKIYTENRWGDGSQLGFKYLITEIK